MDHPISGYLKNKDRAQAYVPVVELVRGEAKNCAEAKRAEERVEVNNIILVVLELAPDFDSGLCLGEK